MGPSINARRLAIRLRELRERSQLSQDDVHDHIGISRKTMSRIETAQSVPKARDLKALLDLYQADEEERWDIEKTARTARDRGWWAGEPYSGAVSPGLAMYVSLEDSSKGLRRWLSHGIHGLLQTPDYARAVEAATKTPATLSESRVRLRLERQQRAEARELDVWTIMDESVLRRIVGSRTVMAWQLQHLITLATRPGSRLRLQILPFELGGAFVAPADFTIFEMSDGAQLAADDGTFSVSLYDRPELVSALTMVFGALSSNALDQEASIELIETIAKEYEKHG